MSSFIIRNMDEKFWSRVKAKAAHERITIRELILKLLNDWLGDFLA